MIHVLTSYDFRGPVINPRRRIVTVQIDPLNIGEYQPFEVELDLFDAIETEAKWSILLDEEMFVEGSVHNDYYGLGTSIDDPIKSAIAQFEKFKGENFNVVVSQSVITKTSTWDRHQAPFYGGCIRLFHAPYQWKIADQKDDENRIDHIVWRNGQITDEGKKLHQELAEIEERDVAGSRRK